MSFMQFFRFHSTSLTNFDWCVHLRHDGFSLLPDGLRHGKVDNKPFDRCVIRDLLEKDPVFAGLETETFIFTGQLNMFGLSSNQMVYFRLTYVGEELTEPKFRMLESR